MAASSITVLGELHANEFHGDGSNLTGINRADDSTFMALTYSSFTANSYSLTGTENKYVLLDLSHNPSVSTTLTMNLPSTVTSGQRIEVIAVKGPTSNYYTVNFNAGSNPLLGNYSYNPCAIRYFHSYGSYESGTAVTLIGTGSGWVCYGNGGSSMW